MLETTTKFFIAQIRSGRSYGENVPNKLTSMYLTESRPKINR